MQSRCWFQIVVFFVDFSWVWRRMVKMNAIHVIEQRENISPFEQCQKWSAMTRMTPKWQRWQNVVCHLQRKHPELVLCALVFDAKQVFAKRRWKGDWKYLREDLQHAVKSCCIITLRGTSMLLEKWKIKQVGKALQLPSNSQASGTAVHFLSIKFNLQFTQSLV